VLFQNSKESMVPRSGTMKAIYCGKLFGFYGRGKIYTIQKYMGIFFRQGFNELTILPESNRFKYIYSNGRIIDHSETISSQEREMEKLLKNN